MAFAMPYVTPRGSTPTMPPTFLAALYCFFVAFTLIHVFAAQLEAKWGKHEVGFVSVTLALIISELFQSLSLRCRRLLSQRSWPSLVSRLLPAEGSQLLRARSF